MTRLFAGRAANRAPAISHHLCKCSLSALSLPKGDGFLVRNKKSGHTLQPSASAQAVDIVLLHKNIPPFNLTAVIYIKKKIVPPLSQFTSGAQIQQQEEISLKQFSCVCSDYTHCTERNLFRTHIEYKDGTSVMSQVP